MKSGFSILELAKNVATQTRVAVPFSNNSDHYFPIFTKEEPEDYSAILYIFFRANLGNRASWWESNKAIYEEIRRKLGVEFLSESTFKNGLNGITALFPLTLYTAGKTFNSIHELANYVKRTFKPDDNTKKRGDLEFVEANAIRALKNRIGNCGETSSYAFLLLMENQDIDPSIEIRLERCGYKVGDHAFVVLNRTAGNLDDISSWNDDTVICDPWVGQAYTIGQWKKWNQGIEPKPPFYILEGHYAVELIDPFTKTFTHAYVGEKQNLSHGISIHSDKWLNKNSSTTKPFRPLKLITSKMNTDLAAMRQLYQAAKIGDLNAVTNYILSSTHRIDFSVLMELAIENNHKNIVEYLLKNNHIDLKKDYLWYLRLALANNHIEIFDHLSKALSFQLSSNDYYQLLFPLARNGNLSLFKKFIANVNINDLLHGGSSFQYGSNLTNLMSAAVENGHSDILNQLISLDTEQYLYDRVAKRELLYHACKHNQLDLAKRFISEGAKPDKISNSLFFSVVKENQQEIAMLLLENNVNIHDMGYYKKQRATPYHMAMINGNLDLALAILKKSLTFDYSPKNYATLDIDGKNLLHLAVRKNELQIVEQTLQTKKFDINQPTREKLTALAIASDLLDKNNPEKSNLDIILALAKEGAHCEPYNYGTLLQEKLTYIINKAIENNQVDILKKCGQIATLCKMRDVFDQPLKLAILQNQMSIVSQLLDAGADIKYNILSTGYKDDDPLPLAVTMANKTGNTDMLKLLLDRNEITNYKAKGYVALAHAIDRDSGISIDILKMLIKHPNIDINLVPNRYYGAALHLASLYGTSECVQVLLSNKTTLVNQLDYHGRTALHIAVGEGRNDIIKELLKHPDIDYNCMVNGKTALMLAETYGHTETVKILTDYIENKKTTKDLTETPEITQTGLGFFANPEKSNALSSDNTPDTTQPPPQIKKD